MVEWCLQLGSGWLRNGLLPWGHAELLGPAVDGAWAEHCKVGNVSKSKIQTIYIYVIINKYVFIPLQA